MLFDTCYVAARSQDTTFHATGNPIIRRDDIDPTLSIDENGPAWLFWGNSACYYAKLKSNMIKLDGDIKTISLPNFTEAPARSASIIPAAR